MSDKAHMNGDGESDSCVVPAKSANNLTPEVSAEQMEGRRLVKGNAGACSKFRTQRRIWLARGTNLHTIGLHASRHHLRQEPDALVALVRICGGGVQQCASLLCVPSVIVAPDQQTSLRMLVDRKFDAHQAAIVIGEDTATKSGLPLLDSSAANFAGNGCNRE